MNAVPTCAIPTSASSDADSASRALPSGAPGSLARCRAPLFITAHRSAWAIPLAAIQQYKAWTSVSPQRGASAADVSTIVRNPIGLEATWETMSSVRPLARAIRCSSSIVPDRDVEGLPAISVSALCWSSKLFHSSRSLRWTRTWRLAGASSQTAVAEFSTAAPEQRERGSRVDDVEILHEHPECVPVIGSAYELSADRLRNKVRERGQIILERLLSASGVAGADSMRCRQRPISGNRSESASLASRLSSPE